MLRENQPVCFLPFFRDALIDKREHKILKTLDKGRGELSCLTSGRLADLCHFGVVLPAVVEEVDDPITICRIYACIADVLGFMAQEGGIRGGPASNVSWRTAFSLLEVRCRRERT